MSGENGWWREIVSMTQQRTGEKLTTSPGGKQLQRFVGVSTLGNSGGGEAEKQGRQRYVAL